MPSTAPLETTRPRVLIVEDDGQVCELVSDILVAEGLDTVCVSTGQAAYARLREIAFQALVIDINLGRGVTGFDVARFGRQIDPMLPVIYVSGESSPASFAAFGVPGSRFVAKPFTPDELLQSVQAVTGANEP